MTTKKTEPSEADVVQVNAMPITRASPGHTTEEANELWCPFAKFDNINAFVVAPAHRGFQKVSRDGNEQIIGGQNCISTKCACWKWTDGHHSLGTCGLSA